MFLLPQFPFMRALVSARFFIRSLLCPAVLPLVRSSGSLSAFHGHPKFIDFEALGLFSNYPSWSDGLRFLPEID